MNKKQSYSKEEITFSVMPESYSTILHDLKMKIKTSQLQAMSAVNMSLISLYREIGQIIYEQQEKAAWGDSIVEQLAKDLQHSFPGMKGFSARNLWRMKDFYLSYRSNEKLTALLAEISWTHHLVILEKCMEIFSMVCLMAYRMLKDGKMPVARTSWYCKENASFSDVLAFVRQAIWRGKLHFSEYVF